MLQNKSTTGFDSLRGPEKSSERIAVESQIAEIIEEASRAKTADGVLTQVVNMKTALDTAKVAEHITGAGQRKIVNDQAESIGGVIAGLIPDNPSNLQEFVAGTKEADSVIKEVVPLGQSTVEGLSNGVKVAAYQVRNSQGG